MGNRSLDMCMLPDLNPADWAPSQKLTTARAVAAEHRSPPMFSWYLYGSKTLFLLPAGPFQIQYMGLMELICFVLVPSFFLASLKEIYQKSPKLPVAQSWESKRKYHKIALDQYWCSPAHYDIKIIIQITTKLAPQQWPPWKTSYGSLSNQRGEMQNFRGASQ